MTKLIDFNDLATGTVVDTEYKADGVTISALGGAGKAMIFDTAKPTGGDRDLATDTLGNVLIISEDGDSADPDDEAHGGTLRFAFDDAVTVDSLTFLDIEESAWVKFYGADGSWIKTVDVHGGRDNGQREVDFDVDGVSRMDVILGGSGAIDNLKFSSPNAAPDAVDDCDITDEDTPIVIDLLANDSDPDGDALRVTAVHVPAEQGRVIDNGDGTATFTPAPDFNGTATISYDISDGNGGRDWAEHIVHVKPVNDAPVARDDAAHTDENDPVIIDVLGNDSDPENDPLSVVAASSPDGDVAVNDDGTLTFTPAPGFSGDAVIDYTVSDGALTDSAQVGVTVSPSADPFDDACTFELLNHSSNGGQYGLRLDDLNAPGRLVFDFEADAAAMFMTTEADTIRVFGTMQGSDGDLYRVDFLYGGASRVEGDDDIEIDDRLQMTNSGVLERLGADGEVVQSYDLSDKAGTHPFSFRLGDEDDDQGHRGANNDSGWGWLSVSGVRESTQDWIFEVGRKVDDAEGPIAQDDTATTPEDVAVIIDVLKNDFDPMGQALSVTEAASDQGAVVVNPDGTLTFTPAPDFNGAASITYTVADVDGNLQTASVAVDVTPVNDAPVAVDDTAQTDEDLAVRVDLLGNDTDVDGDALTLTAVSVPPEAGSVRDNGDGTVTFTPAPDFNGTATITYTVADGNGGTDEGTARVEVAPVNDAPVAVDDVVPGPVVTDNGAVHIAPLVNDSDPDGDPIVLRDASVVVGAGTAVVVGQLVEFTPAPGFEGPVEISYTIADPGGLTDTAIISLVVQDGIVSGTGAGELIDAGYLGDPGGDRVDAGDNIFSPDPAKADDDIIKAGGGNDTVVAGAGDDIVFGGAGADRLHGSAGDDQLSGEAGRDTINGGAGDDTIDGGADNDVLNGGDGADVIFGGDGDDVITASDPDNDLRVDKGYSGLFTGEEGTPAAENERDFVDGGAGNDTIRTGDDRDTIIGGSGDDVIDGGIDDDRITGDGGDDRIVGGEGNDLIKAGAGNDTVYAGNDPDLGLDALNIEDNSHLNPLSPDLRPDNGRDTVFGGDGDDVLFGADDADVLYGEAGADVIDGEIDNDLIDGGTGNDTLRGGQGRDTILGGDGADKIDGGLNRDLIDGGAGNDTITGGNGKDTILGGSGDDVLGGGTGEDSIDGGTGADDITGSTGNDILKGGAGNDTINSGGGADVLSGGDDRDLFVNVNAGDHVDGNEGGDDFDTLDLRGSAGPGGSLTVTKDPANAENGTVTYRGADGTVTGTLDFVNIEAVVPCFTPGTLIATPAGECAIETLEVGDRVITRDNGIQQVRWTGRRALSGADLHRAPHLAPVLIRQGALGGGLPERDMMVSPQHRVLVASDRTALYFEEREVLVAAKHLVGRPGITGARVPEVTYIHVMFDRHEVILSDGAWTESFQPGAQTLGAMDASTRAELVELFPELDGDAGGVAYAAARRTLKKHEAALLD